MFWPWMALILGLWTLLSAPVAVLVAKPWIRSHYFSEPVNADPLTPCANCQHPAYAHWSPNETKRITPACTVCLGGIGQVCIWRRDVVLNHKESP